MAGLWRGGLLGGVEAVCLVGWLDGQARGQAVCLVGWLVRSEAISLDGEAAREAVSCGSLW